MNTIKKRNRIVLCLCSILVMFASIFAFIPLNKENKTVYADTVTNTYTFNGSNLYYFDTYRYNWSWAELYSVLFKTSISTTNDIITITPSFYLVGLNDANISYTEYDLFNDGGMISSINVSSGFDSYIYYFSLDDYTFNRGAYFPFVIVVNGDFNSQVTHVSLYKSDYFHKPDPNFTGSAMYIEYFDKNGSSLSFQFYVPSNYMFDSRIYYFNDPSLYSDNELYQLGYDAGDRTGYDRGYQQGSNQGYSSGYQSGKDDGYWIGYDEALNNSNKYSFTNLISAVIDVPVQTFTSLFNFEILGVNLSGFFLGLLTCCIVIGVIRLIL